MDHMSPNYLQLQSDRCQQMSRNCMDMSTARDLRLMAEEYQAEALKVQPPAISSPAFR